MILARLTVAGWRNLLGEVSLGPLDPSLNVIHAPNGTGKSTLFEALRWGIFDSHTLSGKAVDAVRPWGRDLSPRVTVEFTHGGEAFRAAKGFLDRPFSRLERKESGTFKPFKEGKAADEFLRGLFRGEPPGRGPARAEHLGLCQVLWAPQGGLETGPLSTPVVTRVRKALGAQAAGSAGSAVEREIAARHREFFTETGKLKSGKNAPALASLGKELERAGEERERAAAAYRSFEEASRLVEELRAVCAAASREAAEAERDLAKARREAEEYRRLAAERDVKKKSAEAAKAAHGDLSRRIEGIEGAKKEIEGLEKEIAPLTGDLESADREIVLLEKKAAGERTRLAEMEKETRARLDGLARRLDLARRFEKKMGALAALAERLEKVEAARAELEETKKKRASLAAPDRGILKAVGEAVKERDEAAARLESFKVRVKIVPRKSMEVEVIEGEERGARSAGAEAPLVVEGAPGVVLRFPDGTRVEASGPEGEKERKARDAAAARLAELARPFGTSDPERLEALEREAAKMDIEASRIEERLGTLLRGERIEDLRVAKAAAEAALLDAGREMGDPPAGLHAAKELVEELEKARDSENRRAEKELSLLRAGLERGEKALAAARSRRAGLAASLEEKKKAFAAAGKRLEELEKDGRSPAERRRELERKALEWEAARASLAGLKERLSKFSGDPDSRLEELERRRAAADEKERRARDEEKTAEGRVAQLAGSGPYSLLAVCEERVAALEERRETEERRAGAVRMLFETVRECRSAAFAGLTGPVEKAAARLLERIAGPGLGKVLLGEGLAPRSVHPGDAPEPVSLDNLSGGEAEQLHFVSRLALAEVLAGADGEAQLLVLDDVFNATDPGRFARILEIVEEMAEKFQIVLLTCDPDRCRVLEKASFFDLEEIVRAAP